MARRFRNLSSPRTMLWVIAAIGLSVGACSSAENSGASGEAYDTADRILAAAAANASASEPTDRDAGTDRPPEVLAASAECVLETREDEYGLEFEACAAAEPTISNGQDEPDARQEEEPAEFLEEDQEQGEQSPISTVLLPVQRFDELVADLPAGDGRDQLTELGRALGSMDDACAVSLEGWGAALHPVLEQLTLAEEAVLADSTLDDLLGGEESRELARAVVERVMIPSGCTAPAPASSPISGIDSNGVAELSAKAAAAVEPLYQALWGQAKSPFFYHPDELAHRRWMREEALLGTDLDVVVVGTSQTLLGIEADLLGAQLELEAGNAALPGAVAEVQQYWLPEVVEAIDPSVVLWGIGPLDLVTICRPDGRADEFARLSTLKRDVLAAFPATETISPFDLIVGPPGSAAYDSSPTSQALDRRFPQPRGDAFEFAQPDREQLRSSLEQFRAPFERADYCADRLPVIEATIADLVARGHRVVIFGTPIAPSLAATYDGGIEALSVLVDDAARDLFQPAGADYLGMMTSIDDDGFWYDVVHPTRAGGETLTAEVATALAGAG